MRLINISPDVLVYGVPLDGLPGGLGGKELRELGPFKSAELAPGTNISIRRARAKDLRIEGRAGETITFLNEGGVDEPEPNELPPPIYSRGFPIGYATSDFEPFNSRPGSQVLWKGNIRIPAPRMPEQPIKRWHAVRNMLAAIRVGAWRQARRWLCSIITGKFRGQIVDIVG